MTTSIRFSLSYNDLILDLTVEEVQQSFNRHHEWTEGMSGTAA